MDKKAIKTFAIESRKKLIEEVKYQASLLGITAEGIADPVEKTEGMEVYDIGAATPNTIYDEAINQRKSLVKRINEKSFDNVVEEVAYTWFNRIIAVRFMEVNDYLPTRVRVLSSGKEAKTEPDIVTEAPNIDLDMSDEEIDKIHQLKNDNEMNKLFKLLFIKQCNKLNEILPELFEKTSDYTELLLFISFTNEESVVRQLIDNIPEEDFTDQVEIIGWLYQYYNTELKDDTFKQLKKRLKISKERIPAATQLFTPDWIVRYMVENSLGRLWLESHPDSNLKENWKYYLDEAEQEPEVQIELAKIRENSKNLKPEDIKIMDPAMGSGHILVYGFEVLMQIYTSVGYSERDATISILENNLYGLEIDDRAYQLAYFAIMMKARSFNRTILTKKIEPQICSIQESNSISDELINFIANGDDYIKKNLRYLSEIFTDSKEYGSIIDVKQINFSLIDSRLVNIKNNKYSDFRSMNYQKNSDKLFSILKQAIMLSEKYDVVVTNPPYMGSNGMNKKLSSYLRSNYPDSKKDIFAVFIEKCQKMLNNQSFLGMITQHSFMFLSSYEKLRKKILCNDIINMAHLGTRAFEEIGGEVVQTTTFVLRNSDIKDYVASYCRLVNLSSQKEKEKGFLSGKNFYLTKKIKFMVIPGIPIAYWVSKKFVDVFEKGTSLNKIATIFEGLKTRNNQRFLRYWFEIYSDKWKPYSKGGTFRKWYGNYEYVVNWGENGGEVREFKKSSGANFKYFFVPSITYSALTSYKFSGRYINKSIFGGGGGGIVNTDYVCYILGFVNSTPYNYILNAISSTLNFEVGQIGQQPLIISKQHRPYIDSIVTQNIKISQTDWDSFETSWDFKKHPFLIFCARSSKNSDDKNLTNQYPLNTKIAESFAEWKSFTETQFNQLKANEEELNRLFIEIYGFQDELSYKVDDQDITLKTNTIYRYKQNRRKKDAINKDNVLSYEIHSEKFLLDTIKEFISYAVGCMLGRYSIDEEGLIYAGGQWDSSKYSQFLPDDDNIIPILDTEYFEDDIVGRFVEFVKVIFGKETLEENLDFIAKSLKKKGKTSREIIRNYFLKDFYKDHLITYKNHPIYWQFDSGTNNGFKALIYMHRYEPELVARVRIDYLHKTQKALEIAIVSNDGIIESSNSPSEKSKAVKAKTKLVKQLEETKKYDEALAHLANQKIEIDLDDGVKVNYAKFKGVKVSEEGKKPIKIDLLKKI